MVGRVELLGGFDVTRNGQAVDELKSRPTCGALLAFLAAESSATRDEAAALLWPEADDRRGRHALTQTVYQIRKLLGPDWILSHGPELRLGNGITVDAREAEAAFENGDWEGTLRLTEGRFLAGWHLRNAAPFESWVDDRDRHHRSMLREASRRRIAEALDAGDHAAVIETARRWLHAEPTREEAQVALVRSLLALDRAAAALEAHAVYADRLAELGGVPGPEVVTLAASARERSRGDPGSRRSAARGAAHRLLVLPFAHAGPPERVHLTQGLTEELTGRLSRLPALAVIAQPSARRVVREGRTLAEVGRALGADSVLEGTVRWSADDSRSAARTNVLHVRASDGVQLWSAALESDARGVSAHRDEIVARTLEALGLGAAAPDPHDEEDDRKESPAYELCIRGLEHWHRRSEGALQDAIDLFVRAVESDPSYARAYGCLALAYALVPSFAGESNREWTPKARRSARAALELDPDLVEGHLAAGLVAWSFDLDADAAGHHWGRVLHREPSNVQGLSFEAYRHALLGEGAEARRHAREAVTLNPLSVSVNFDAGLIDGILGDERAALERMRAVLAMAPAFTPAAFLLGAHHLRRGDVDSARRAWARIDWGPAWSSLLADLGVRERAVGTLGRLVDLSPRPVHWYAVAGLYTLLEEPDRALHWLEMHLRNLKGEPVQWITGGPSLFLAAMDPLFRPLRDHLRFDALLRAMDVAPPG